MKEGRHMINSYPTRSLREFLAYQSVHHTENTEPPASAPPRIEVEVEVGDGRSEVILVDDETDIEKEAEEFCKKYQLEDYVTELLANTIRDKYHQEKEEAASQDIANQHESLAQTYSNPHARQVLITNSQASTTKRTKGARRSAEKGAGRLLQGYYSKAKKYSLAENYLMENKENQPELNKVSLEICQKLGKENILEHRNRRSQEKMKALLRERQEKEEEMMRQCPFRPKINAISKQVDKQIAYSSAQQQAERRFERLYEDHKYMELRREEERQNHLMEIPFKPALNYISRKIVENKRAVNDSQERMEKKSHMVCSHSSNNSLPHTGRKPKNRNTSNLPIGEYLYAQAMKKNKPKAFDQKVEIKALDYSDHLISILKQKRINEIFTELTQPPHEELYCEDIDPDSETFRNGRHRLFMPIFNEMAEMGISVTRTEFMEASLSLLKTMSPEQKYQVIFPKEKQSQQNQNEGHSINGRSREMTKRSGFDHSDIYNRGLEHRKIVEEKNEKNRENKARDELKHCTFRPILKPTN